METRVKTGMCDGLNAVLVAVESSTTRGYVGIQTIGNTSEICRDGKERAKGALEAVGYVIPNRRIVISFSPADVKKDGSQFDLPMAVSMALLISTKETAIDPNRCPLLNFFLISESKQCQTQRKRQPYNSSAATRSLLKTEEVGLLIYTRPKQLHFV